MIRAVFDTNLLVSAFLSREIPGGVSSELLRFVIDGTIDLYLSIEIADEVVATLSESRRLRRRCTFSPEQAGQYRADLLTLANVVDDPPATPGAVPRDPDDDKIVACAVAAQVPYLVSRDKDLLSIGRYEDVEIIPPEVFLRIVRAQG